MLGLVKSFVQYLYFYSCFLVFEGKRKTLYGSSTLNINYTETLFRRSAILLNLNPSSTVNQNFNHVLVGRRPLYFFINTISFALMRVSILKGHLLLRFTCTRIMVRGNRKNVPTRYLLHVLSERVITIIRILLCDRKMLVVVEGKGV